MNCPKNKEKAEIPARKALVEYCLRLPGAYEDYPFDDDPSSPDAWTVMRHLENRRSFALIFEHGGILNLNLKCDPAEADFLRGVYRSVIPAYHMNKEHWIGVLLDGSVPDKELRSWIDASYRCTLPKRKRKY
ncbi:MmcQ/YjbR family DNA-binding protein [Caproiciproducens sp. NJN-50]|uniref:MmcQ/YjbR family DNA-binding protein n=2 Tax=Acutalibacteraceae TaxID=3082771 RepID=UPI000FFE29A9|nr:MmcQ/YjbR family DNA-binding protein [Caproiciproducens sp. NJN-50]QAT50189.1 MmcQ/YjbR family DNA-binding protein [Caproiciproducens sp. NJN-50]